MENKKQKGILKTKQRNENKMADGKNGGLKIKQLGEIKSGL